MNQKKYLNWKPFLIDVLICSLGAYGGPEAHIGIFIDQMVTKKHYLSEEELIELVALCSILPGPTSTQTIVAIGYKTGGPVLGVLTMIFWALPVLILMTILSFLYQFLEYFQLSSEILRFIGPLAVGFIVVAAVKIGKKVIVDHLTAILLVGSGMITYFFREPWIFPLILLIGGMISIFVSRGENLWNWVKLNPPWIYLFVFIGIALFSILIKMNIDNLIIQLFESFYRYGYLVFGGGQVVVPVMYSELVEIQQYMTNQEFLTGYGLVQGLPGPMFSFSSYVGGIAGRNSGPFIQTLAAIVSGIGIFLPGLLLIYFIYPIWENFKQIRAVRIALKGINAVAGGMIAVAAVIVMQKNGFTIENFIVSILTIVLLLTKKIPAPIIVFLLLIAGFMI